MYSAVTDQAQDSPVKDEEETNGVAAATDSLGTRLRSAREAKGLGVRELSRRVDVSASLISQIEHGRAMPSVTTLYAVSSELGVSLDHLFNAEDGEAGGLGPAPRREMSRADWEERYVHRAGERKSLRFPVGVTWDLLTPTGSNGLEFLYVTYAPDAESTPEDSLFRHQGMEYGWVEKGRLGVTVSFNTYTLDAGDAISFPSTQPHRLFNPSSTEEATAVWVVIGRDADPRTA